MSLDIRPADAKEAAVVARIINLAFAAAGHRRERSAAGLARMISREPGGILLAFKDGDPAGVAVARTFGSLGILAEWAVLPTHKGRGIGDELFTHALDYLARKSAQTVGLVTWADGPLMAYLRRSFRPAHAALAFRRRLDVEPRPLQAWDDRPDGERLTALAHVRRLGDRLLAGLDHAKDAVAGRGDGSTRLYLDWAEPGQALRGYALLEIAPWHEGEDARLARVLALVHLEPEGPSFDAFFDGIERDLAARGVRQMRLSAYAATGAGIGTLLRRGYSCKGALVRMYLRGGEVTSAVCWELWSV